MINLAIAIGCAVISGLLLGIWLSPVEAFIPAMALGIGAYVWMLRRTNKRLESVMLAAQKDMMSQRVDKAIATMEAARVWSRWQFGVESALNSQIGAIHYMREEYNKALPMLEKSDPRNWISRVMLALLYYRKKDYTKMDTEFETAQRFNKKQGLLYSVWAWCHWKQENKEKAMRILARGDEALEGKDEKLKQNLLNLQNDKKMKLKGYNEQWYQFLLEKPQQPKPQMRFRG